MAFNRINSIFAAVSNLSGHVLRCIGQLDDARRCIDEAMTAMEATQEKWVEAELNRAAGEIALLWAQPDPARAKRLTTVRSPSHASSKPGPVNSAPP